MASYDVRRATSIDADPALVHRLITDFHEWRDWSPWEEVDPDVERTYSGASSGVGAHYAWSGNRKAGRGTMEITAATPERVEVELTFLRPFHAVSQVAFALTPHAGATDVEWSMTGEQHGVAGLLGRVISMDRLVGGDFERGLARLKASAEA